LRDPIGQELLFIRDEIVKACPHSGDRIAVVIDHRKPKADCEEKTREVLKVEAASATGGGKRGLDAKPSDENGREYPKQILAHRVEEAEVLREQIVDGLKNELQIVGLHLVSFGGRG
jgi:hypothetical protein